MSIATKLPSVTVSRAMQLYLGALAVAFVLCAPLSFIHRELGAVRNWQLLLSPLLLLALWRADAARLGGEVLPQWTVRLYFATTLLWALTIQLCRYGTFAINGIDFSIFDWMLYNTNHRQFMYSPIYGVNHFGVHQSYILLPLVPLHRLFEHPLFLVTVTGIGVWAAQLPLWRLTQRLAGGGIWPPLVCLALLTSPWMAVMLDGGFRPEALYPVFGLAWILGWVERRPALWIPALLAFLSIKEDASFYVAAVGIGILLFERERWRPALAMVLGSVALFFINVGYLQPLMLEGSIYRQPSYLSFWGHHGNSLREILLGMAKKPLQVLGDILSSRWYRLFAPALFLPLLSRVALFGMAPTLFILGTSSYRMMHEYKTYYPVTLLPFFFWGLLEGQARLGRFVPNADRRAKLFLVAVLCFPLIGGTYAKVREPEWGALRTVRKLGAQLAQEPGLVCVQTVLFPHLPYEKELWPLTESCVAHPGSVAVIRPGFDPYPYTRDQLERLARSGDAQQVGDGFFLVRNGRL